MEVVNIATKLTEDEMIKRLKINNPTIKYIGGFLTSRKEATFQCSICGNKFSRIASRIYSGHCGCPECASNKGVNNLKKRLEINNPTIEYIGGYVEPHKLATFKCKKCNYIWNATAYEVYSGKSHCRNCLPSPYLMSEDNIKEKIKQNNPTIEYVHGYTGSLNKATFRCKKCGNIWDATAFAVYLGNTGCPKCAFSKGEDRIANYLENRKIPYEHGYVFDDCKNIYNLPFDFYLSAKNLCIEYDGEHHFFPIIRSKSMTSEDAEEKFRQIQMRDTIKNNYCKDNNINLIRIPYTDFNKIEIILDEYFGYNTTS